MIMNDTQYACIEDFLTSHRADDVVYAVKNPAYFELSQVQQLTLHAWLFALITEATK